MLRMDLTFPIFPILPIECEMRSPLGPEEIILNRYAILTAAFNLAETRHSRDDNQSKMRDF